MPLKILCAGYGKDEKFEIEKVVRSVFGPPLDRESWSISLVKLGSSITVAVDGPDERIRNKSFMASAASLRDQLRELLLNNGYEAGGRTAAPPAAPPRGQAASPSPDPTRTPSGGWPSRVTQSAVSTPPRPAAAAPAPPRPAAPTAPAAPRATHTAAPAAAKPRGGSASGRHARDRHQCPSCGGGFVVTYELQPNEPSQLVAVACPHCWKLDRVEVGESAAIERAYRADKA